MCGRADSDIEVSPSGAVTTDSESNNLFPCLSGCTLGVNVDLNPQLPATTGQQFLKKNEG